MSESTQINVSTTTEIVNVDVTETLQPVSLECFFAPGSAQDTVVNVSENVQNIELNVTETQSQNVEIDFFYPQGPAGPAGINQSLWGFISGTLSAQSDLWAYLSAIGTSNFDIATLNNYLSTNFITLCSISTNGQILSAGTDLFDIFLTQGTNSQTLFYISSSYELSISNGNTVNLSSINSTFAANSGKYEFVFTNVQSNSGNWNTAYNTATSYRSVSSTFATNTTLNSVSSLLTPLTLTNSLTGQLLTNTAFNNYQTNVANATATLLPTSIYQSASGNWQSAFTTVQQNSSYWNAVSGITLSAANSYVNQNFLPLSGGTLTGGVTGTTIKLTDTIFTGKTVQAISLTGTAQFVEVEIPGGIKKYLQLFDVTPPNTTYFVDFEDGVKSAYASGTVTLNGINWNLTETLIGTLAQDWKDGLRSARLRGFSSSIMSMLEDKEYGLGTVSLSYDQYGTDTSQATWVVEYSMNSGVIWTSAGTFTATSVVQFFTTTINQPGNGRIRIRHLSGGDLVTNRRANVDNIFIGEYF
jgi:hypothetical protein